MEDYSKLRKLIRESIQEELGDDSFNEGVMKTLKRKFFGVSDEQAAYNEKHGLPDTWRGSKEGYYEKQGEGNSRPSGSN